MSDKEDLRPPGERRSIKGHHGAPAAKAARVQDARGPNSGSACTSFRLRCRDFTGMFDKKPRHRADDPFLERDDGDRDGLAGWGQKAMYN